MNSYDDITAELSALGSEEKRRVLQRFFKTGEGQYGHGDRFMGIPVPVTRGVAKKHKDITTAEAGALLASEWHEVRLCGLLVMGEKMKKAAPGEARLIYDTYLANTARINNWDLVDLSAPQVVGTYLLDKPHDDLYRLDSLDGWGYATDHVLGELPSTTTALQQALDLQNHEHSEYWAKKHVARYFAGFIKPTDDGGQHQVELTLPLYVDQERLRYERGTYFTDRDRLRAYVNPGVKYYTQQVRELRNGWQRYTDLTVNYNYTMWGPDMFNELDVVNDADPLYVQRGIRTSTARSATRRAYS